MIIESVELLKTNANSIESNDEKKMNNETNLSSNKIHMFGSLRVQLKKVAEQMSEFQQLFKAPIIEFDLTCNPNLMTSYKNNICI
jgi:hypothetical protein